MGGRSLVTVVLTAALTAASFPPFGLGPAAFICLVPLLLSTGRDGGRRDFVTGWLAGWASSTAVVWWVIKTVTFSGRIGPVPGTLILLLLTGAMALFWGLFSWARGRILTLFPRWSDIIIAPALWVSLEFARARLPEIAFPWALIGSSQYTNLHLIQISDIFGIWGVSFLVVSVNAAAAHLVQAGWPEWRRDFARLLAPAGVTAILLTASWIYGTVKLNPKAGGTEFRTVVVQGNIGQAVKHDPAYRRESFDVHRDLTRLGAGSGVDLVVWPETAAPFYYEVHFAYREMIRELALQAASPILFGAPGHEDYDSGRELRNQAYLISALGSDIGRYDKVRLVPFGEYVPWKSALFFIKPLVGVEGGFTPGEGPVVLDVPGARVGPLICYEVIFPDYVRRTVRGGAELLVNITNDAWFGRTAASLQHFSAIVFRAVENRRPVARAANTGISGFVDSRGRILLASELFERGAYGASLYPSSEETLYNRAGDFLPSACALIVLGLLAASLVSGVLCRRRG